MPPPPVLPALRSQSYANLDEVSYSHLQWHVAVDFDTQRLQGFAEYAFTYLPLASASRSPVLVLDTHHLDIQRVLVDGTESDFSLAHQEHQVFGRALVVPIAAHATRVRVHYATTSGSSGLQWLPKELTAGKTRPFLFTQCQAIHARIMLPCPDAPACKVPFDASVTVPDWCTCLLSALAHGHTKSHAQEGTHTLSFRQEVPVPSYLLAVVAGELQSVELSARCRVWAEPLVVTKAAHEFAQTEAFLQHAEEITGQPYVWKRYDLVCLPPSFPYGGMENPCLTFVTPTLLAGDRSLAHVVAHEISHSWTGNLVTNRTWQDFWLNEGWTVWLERKIQARSQGDVRAYDVSATMGLRSLVNSVEQLGPLHPYTALVPEADDVDPDDVFSRVPYEKGFNFLHYLSTVVGGADVFDPFAQAYIQAFKFQTVTSDAFRVFFEQYFAHKTEALKQIDWDAWYHAPGMPPVANTFDTTLTDETSALGEVMTTSGDVDEWTKVTSSMTLQTWPATLWIFLLDTLLLLQTEKQATLSAARLDAIDAFGGHHLSTTRNSELRFRWFTLALRAGDLRVLDAAVAFLKEQGRMKFVRPLFRDLAKALGADYAASIFADCREFYHPIAAKMIQRDLEAAGASATATKPGFNTVFIQWLGLPQAYECYSPLLALALGVGVVATAVALSKHR